MHLKVKVKTGAKSETLTKVAKDRYEVAVREKPEANAANKRVLSLIADALGVPVKRLRITKGHHSPSKILSVVTNSV